MKQIRENKIIPQSIVQEAEDSTLRTMFVAISIGVIGLLGYALPIKGVGLSIFFVSFLLAFASLIVGFFTGTLFGMPKRNDVENSDYSLNNSLVEISDWLTKIIVGLGLVNLKQLPNYLMRMGKYVSEASGSTGQSLDVFSMCVVVYFGIFGLYIGYNYMRLVLSQKYKVADDNILRKELKKKDLETQELKTEVEEAKVKAAAIIQEANQISASTIQELDADQYVTLMKQEAERKFRKGLQENPIDPQRNQWGGVAINNNRELQATVSEIASGAYKIEIRVLSTDPQRFPLPEGETVLFALHDTYGQPPFRYKKVEGGVAEISIFSYGSFTVGAMADKGDTSLELNLAELPNVSEYFKTH